MAETGRERQGELVRGVFEILLEQSEPMRAADVLKEVERRVPPTDFENDTYPSSPNVRRYGKIVRFSTIGPVKAGWMVKENGRWSVTDEGRRAYETFTDPRDFIVESGRLYRVWKKQQPLSPDEEAGDADIAVESATTLEEAEETAAGSIREYLGAMPPYDFQQLVAALLKAMGYHISWIAPPGPDQGIDIIAHTDPLGTMTPRIKVQVKRRPKDKVDAPDLRSFMAVLGDQDVGIFISSGGFTSAAEREARGQEKRRLTLIDLDRLVALWIEHYERLDDDDRQQLSLKPVYFLSPPD
jgi:restriction system protein